MQDERQTVVHLRPQGSGGIAAFGALTDEIFRRHLPEVRLVSCTPSDYMEQVGRIVQPQRALVVAQLGLNEDEVFTALAGSRHVRVRRAIVVHDPSGVIRPGWWRRRTPWHLLARAAWAPLFYARYRRSAFRHDDLVAALTGCGLVQLRRVLGGSVPETNFSKLTHPNYIDAPQRRLSTSSAPLRLGFFGFITRHKGLHILVEAMRIVRSKLSAEKMPTLTVRGVPITALDRQSLNRARRALVAAGLESFVEIGGFLPDAEIAAFFEGIDVLALPYRLQHFSSASGPLHWARSFGIPVIASDIPVFQEQVEDGVDGLLASPETPQAWASAILSIAESKVRYHALCLGQRTRAEESSWRSIAAEWAQFLNRSWQCR